MDSREFPHLHLHTTHSHLDGYGTVEAFYENAAKRGFFAMAHTEHGNISSWPQAQMIGEKKGIKPIFGIEAYVVPDASERSRGYNHITLLAENDKGIRNLFSLVKDSFDHGFYYKPRMSWSDLLRQNEGIIAFSGCWSGYAARNVVTTIKNPTAEVAGIPTKRQVEDWLKVMAKRFPGRFFVELMPLQVDLQKDVLALEIHLARQLGIPIVATNDVHYICDGDDDVQDDLVCIRLNSKKNDPERKAYDVNGLFVKTRAEIEEGFQALGIDQDIIEEAIGNAYAVADRCNAKVPKAKPVRYRCEDGIACKSAGSGLSVDVKSLSKNRGDYQADIELVFGVVLRFMWKLRGVPTTEQYTKRAAHEYAILRDKKFLDYMLIIWDLIWAAKNRSDAEGGPILVGPARGSSAGSLICYVLGITEVDPFYDDLVFERFVDINRHDLPDIDIDFPDDEREWGEKYLTQRWGGPEYVGRLISHAFFKGKNALTDIGRIYGLPFWAIERVKSLLIERSSGDARATFTLEDTFKEFPDAEEIAKRFPQILLTRRLEGQIRHTGTHAAGIVVSTEEPLKEVGTFYREGAFWMDKKDGEKFGFLKIDLLGLNTLTVLREAARNIGITGKAVLDFYYGIDLRDQKVIDAFARCDVDGIFQFEGQAQRAVTKQLKPWTYEMVRDLTALSRPGPLHCGGTDTYIANAHSEVGYEISPIELEPIVRDSFGVIIYQEQVLKIMRDIGHMDWDMITDARRHIAKSVGREHFEVFRTAFMKGALEKSKISEELANALWERMCTFGSWAFNRAHAASYTRPSIWTMHMKLYHKPAFYAAMAGFSSSEERRAISVRAFARECGPILPVDINESKAHFSLSGNGLRPGLGDVKGIGPKAAQAILAGQPFSSFADFLRKVPSRTANAKVRRLLHLIGAFYGLPDTEAIRRDRELTEADEYRKKFKTLRALASAHCFWVLPVNFPELRKQLRCKPLKEMEERDHTVPDVRVTGRIRHINQRDYKELGSEHKLAKLKPGEETRFINITIEDEEDFIMITVPRRRYRQMKDLVFKELKEGSIVFGRGAMLAKSRRIFLEELMGVEIE